MRQLRLPKNLQHACALTACLVSMSACLGEHEEPVGAHASSASSAALEERPAPSKKDAGLTIRTRPDGLQEIDMRGRFQHQVVMRRSSDGGFQHDCASHERAERATWENHQP